jgi:hypothetical protein
MKAFVRGACRAALKIALSASLLNAAVMLSCAEETAAGRLGRSAAGLWFDIAPLVELTNRAALSTSDSVSADDLAWFYERPALATLGFQLRTGPCFAAMSVEMQQGAGERLLGGSLTNLPVSHDWKALCSPTTIRASAFSREKGRDGFFRSAGGINSAPASIL